MRTILFGATLSGAAMLALTTVPAHATVDIAIDLATQHMHVQGANASYDWPVSTAREGYVTPTGTFAPQRLAEVYHSKKYDNAPMPHAIFFYYGFAIHGSYETKHLGHTASHGCVRISPANAAKLYSMVQAEGATITISGNPPWAKDGYSAAVASSSPAPGKGFLSFLGF